MDNFNIIKIMALVYVDMEGAFSCLKLFLVSSRKAFVFVCYLSVRDYVF